MIQAVFAAEAFLQTVDVDDMTRDQLEIHAIRKILDSHVVNRRNLPAVPDSFNQIKDVEVISLNGSGIRVVPECINRLTGCRDLDLGHCKLNRDDSFPDTFWQLTGLERLGLYGNNLTSIPSGIGQLSSLTFLNLGENNLVSLPDEIYQLTNLTGLSLGDNKLESISEDIGKLTNLIHLFLYNNNLMKLPKSIGNLVNLDEAELEISGNPLKSLPDSIRKVEHALGSTSKSKYKLLLEDVEYRVTQRVQRRLVILLAKAGPPLDEDDEEAVEKHYNQAKYQVLQDPDLRIKIAKYIDWDGEIIRNNQGTVKWFNKGFGFIVVEDGADIFVHYTGIRDNGNSGFRSLDAGQKVEFKVTQGQKGPQATDVVVMK